MNPVRDLLETWRRGAREMVDRAPDAVRALGLLVVDTVAWFAGLAIAFLGIVGLFWPLGLLFAYNLGVSVPYWPASGAVSALWLLCITLPIIFGLEEDDA